MNKKDLLVAAGAAVLGVALIALPSSSKSQNPGPATPAPPIAAIAPPNMDDAQGAQLLTFGDEGGSWLGVETHEVTTDKVKELKLPAERGALIGKVLQDSPAAKSGLKEGDVITEVNGQRVEGAMQFRRMIREIPAGRTVQLTVWREGRAQTISATIGKTDESRTLVRRAAPQVFRFRMPELPEVAPIPDVPSLEWDGGNLLLNRPRLGIDAEDLNDQLGAYFGAPESEGVLVRSVNPGSAAERAGAKAGDVITSFNGERIHSLAELRSKLAESDGKSVKLGVLRNKSALTLDVEIPSAKAKAGHKTAWRTRI